MRACFLFATFSLAFLGCTPVLTSHPDTGILDSGWEWESPENSWPSQEPPNGLVGEGFAEGQVPPDFRFQDQFGDTVSLWQFYGLVVVMDFSTMWCSPCQELAADVDATYTEYKDQGFIYVTILPENVTREIPTQDDLMNWADYFQITAPVLADDSGYTYAIVSGDDGFPWIIVLDRELTVYEDQVVPVNDSNIRATVLELL